MTLKQKLAARFSSAQTDEPAPADLIARINEARTETERWQIAREAKLRRRFGAR